MTFRAKYDGTCAECGEAIAAGDLLDWSDERVVHVGCLKAAKPARPTCPKCWQELSLTNACGCEPE